MTHYIHITAGTEDEDADYTFECTELTSQCECWLECRECEPTEEQDEEGEAESHGVFHRYINGYWCTATGICGVHMMDVGIDEFYYKLYESSYAPDEPKLPSGRYEIEVEWEDEYVIAHLMEPVVTV